MTETLPILLPIKELTAQFWKPEGKLLAPDAHVKRDELVARSEAIERVAGEASRQAAADVLGETSAMIKNAEAVGATAKKPFTGFGKRIGDAITGFNAPLELQKARLKRLLGDYQLEQDRLARAERQKQDAELQRLQNERRAAELAAATATKPEEIEKAQEAVLVADLKAAEVIMSAPAVEPAKVEGAKIKRYFKTEVLDPAALYRVFPECIELKPRMSAINACVNKLAETLPEGEAPKLPGCRVTSEVDFSSR